MAATNSTTNLGLPQWVATDKPEMTDFNTAMSDIDNTVAAHLAESATKHIKEAGTNANGSYVRFDDGTMICYGFRSFTGIPVTSTLGSLFYAPGSHTTLGSYPSSFIAPPSVSIYGSNNTGYTMLIGTASRPTSAALPSINVIRPSSTPTLDVVIEFVAVGRWK